MKRTWGRHTVTNTEPAAGTARKTGTRKPAGTAVKAAPKPETAAKPEAIPAPATEIEVRNPATGALAGTVPIDSADTVAAKVRELRAAQPAWEALGPDGRKEWLLKLQDWLVDNTDHLADVLQSETGKARVDSLIDPAFSVDLTGYYARRAAKFLADEHPSPHSPLARVKQLNTVFRPYQVVGVITPWNFPLAMPVIDVIPALAAGAAVILKPSEVTPLSAVELARGWREIGAPPVFEVVTGAGETGAAVVGNADYIQFTGSTATGRKIAAACTERMIPFSLELGGKDPAIVLADADLDRAAHGIAFGGLFNAGQVCISVERVYVEAPVYDQFLAKLTAAVKQVRQGVDGRKPEFDMGALANENQAQIVQRHVEEAVKAGARVTTGGKRTGVGTLFEPTVLADVDHTMTCMTEETFGPTLPVMKVADEAEAIRLANDSIYGLSASVWSGDKDRAERVARQLNAGAVNINDVFANMFSFALPMGGWGQSGTGARWGGPNGVRKYCRQQAITKPILPTQTKEPLWFPYSPPKLTFAMAAMRAAGTRGLRRINVPAIIKTVRGL
ncbi:Lactaldehyde dehydrogenase [Nocardia seriolae]|uniref:Lactaldehyde dehydrogenase n=1 Tax=Nocardia seriolae TaxID=37332 RepID=A0ABC8AJJ6_9NOCA|nr:Lactaldehyde dehydrogenase [Nocardia seriolae]